jgi:hypothetical protein
VTNLLYCLSLAGKTWSVFDEKLGYALNAPTAVGRYRQALRDVTAFRRSELTHIERELGFAPDSLVHLRDALIDARTLFAASNGMSPPPASEDG